LTKILGLGVAGMGWMGELHTRALLRLPHHFPELDARVVPVSVADPDSSRAATAQAKYGFSKVTTQWQDLIDDPQVDMLSITTPNRLHGALALSAIAANKPFWVEKPACLAWAEVDTIADAARAAGVVSTVGFDYELAPAVQEALLLLRQPTLGAPQTYRGYFLADYAADPDVALSWRFQRAQAGSGVVGDLLSHVVDLALLLCGDISDVLAESTTFITSRPLPTLGAVSHFTRAQSAQQGRVENEDHVACLVRFASGAKGVLEVGRTIRGHHVNHGFQLRTSAAELSWDFQRMNELHLAGLDFAGGKAAEATVYAKPGFQAFDRFQPGPGIPMGYDDLKVIEAHRFVSSILQGAPERPDIFTMQAVAHVLSAIEASAKTNSWVAVGGNKRDL